MKFSKWLMLVPLLALPACSSNRVVLITSTGINMSADATKREVNIGYRRTEGIMGPTFINDTGGVAPMVAGVGMEGGVLHPVVVQYAALGDAAIAISGSGPVTPRNDACSNNNGCKGDTRKHFYGTSTVLGFNFVMGELKPLTVVLGFDRTEYANFPLLKTDKCAQDDPKCLATFPSTLSVFRFEGQTSDDRQANLGQYFATGIAATQLANSDQVRTSFKNGLSNLIDPKAERGAVPMAADGQNTAPLATESLTATGQAIQ